MTLPTFLVVGAPRCGTTSLHYYLASHPQVCMSLLKEPNHFLFSEDGRPLIDEPSIIRKSTRSRDDYERLFRPRPEHTAVGDVSPLYLYTRDTPRLIHGVCGPDTRIVCLLRSPAERAWSHHLHAFAEDDPGRAQAHFKELVGAEMEGGPGYAPYRTATHLLRLGRYAEQVQRYRDCFGEDRVLVLLTEDLEREPDATVTTTTAFVGAPRPHRLEDTRRYNTSGIRSQGALGRARGMVRAVQPTLKAILPARVAAPLGRLRMAADEKVKRSAPPLDPALRAAINDWVRDDVERLQEMIGRDLAAWLEPGAA